MMPWYIDAIDVRGGLAVGTQRNSDLMQDSWNESGPSVFISPPAFAPEFVQARTTGFALGRNYAQTGLFNDGQEVPFDSLAALAEFVRRSYLRGTGGDGAGENGGSFPPPAPEGGGRGEGEGLHPLEGDEGEKDPAMALLEVARANSHLAQLMKVGESRPGSILPRPDMDIHRPSKTRGRRLARGALRVLRELFRRRAVHSLDELHWATTWEMLLGILARMGLPSVIIHEFNDPHSAFAWTTGKRQPTGHFEQILLHLFEQRYDWPYVRWYRMGWSSRDTFDCLAALPAPPQVVPFAPANGQNLQAVLAAVTSTPAAILSLGGVQLEEEAAELAVFAAACLNIGNEHIPYSYHHEDYAELVPGPIGLPGAALARCQRAQICIRRCC